MHIIYHHDLLSIMPSGILTYIINLIKNSSEGDIHYWSIEGDEKTVTIGSKSVCRHKIPLYGISWIPLRIRIAISIIRYRNIILSYKQPILANENIHAVLLSGSIGRRSRVTLVSHGSNDKSLISSFGLREFLWQLFWDLFAIIFSNHIIVVSKQAMSLFHYRYPFWKKKVTFIPTMVDDELHGGSERPWVREYLQIPKDEVVLVFAGRLSPEKRVDAIIAAFAEFRAKTPCSRLLVVGDGECGDSLKDLTGRLGVGDSVNFLGALDHAKVVDILAEADMAVLLSSFEGTSLFLLESLAVGTPVIASDVADHRSIIGESGSGRVVSLAAEPCAVAAEMADIVRNRQAMSQCARREADKYRASSVVPQIEAVLKGKASVV